MYLLTPKSENHLLHNAVYQFFVLECIKGLWVMGVVSEEFPAEEPGGDSFYKTKIISKSCLSYGSLPFQLYGECVQEIGSLNHCAV